MGHIHTNVGEYDYTASAYIVHDNKLLLLFHHKLHLWLPPGGHVELNETPFEAVYREIEEECGIPPSQLTFIETSPAPTAGIHATSEQCTSIPLPFDIEAQPIGKAHRHIDFSYAFTSSTSDVTPEEDGASDLRWYTLEEVRTLSPMPPSVYHRFAFILRQLNGEVL